MYGILIFLHLLVCFGLVAVVLVQSGTKGGGLAGGAFGGSAQTVFGGRGATDFITRATMVLGTLFFLTSLVLAKMTAGPAAGGSSLIQQEARRAGAGAPAAPGGRSAPPARTAPTRVPLGGTKPAPGSPAPVTPPGGK
jgi:preprotein translocase subunit SecG